MKKIIKKILMRFGYVLVQNNAVERPSMSGALRQVAKFIKPDVIFDVGAAFGTWSVECKKFFPEARYFLFEPLEEYRRILESVAQKHKNFTLIPMAADSTEGELQFNVHEDLVGSSVKKEAEGKDVDGLLRRVPCTTLDSVFSTYGGGGSCLIKIDVQGGELDVLAGAQKVLKYADCVILEVSFFRSFKDGPDVLDVMHFMKQQGFIAYDVISLLYRPYDGALSQADIAFVKENGKMREFSGFATPDQRKIQNERFKLRLMK